MTKTISISHPPSPLTRPPSPILLLHGMHRTAFAMRTFARAFARRGHVVFNLTYRSMKQTLEENADSVAERLAVFGEGEFDIVAHSMGGLVARCLLARHPRVRARRLVMIATPNRGSELAARLQKISLFHFLYGKPAAELSSDSDFIKTLPHPRCEFGIIAGGRGKKWGMVPWVRGDNDGLVSVKSAHLEGAKDFILLKLDHRRLMHNRKVIQQTLHFLEHGQFAR